MSNAATFKSAVVSESSEAQTPREDAPRVRRLRADPRMRVSMRALLVKGETFQQTTICDISRSGAGLHGAYAVLPGDAIVIQLLSGRALPGRVRWWVGGRCGVAFETPLDADDDLLHPRRATLRAGVLSTSTSHQPAEGGAHTNPSELERFGERIGDALSAMTLRSRDLEP